MEGKKKFELSEDYTMILCGFCKETTLHKRIGDLNEIDPNKVGDEEKPVAIICVECAVKESFEVLKDIAAAKVPKVQTAKG